MILGIVLTYSTLKQRYPIYQIICLLAFISMTLISIIFVFPPPNDRKLRINYKEEHRKLKDDLEGRDSICGYIFSARMLKHLPSIIFSSGITFSFEALLVIAFIWYDTFD
jgi:hypothetical protein